MARDYGSRRKSRSSAPQQLLVVILTFLLGYFAASIADIKTIATWVGEQVASHNEQMQPIDKSRTQTVQAPQKPKFEFYTLLTDEKGNRTNAVSTKTAPATKNLQSATVTLPGSSAIAQAANNAAKPAVVAGAKVTEAKPERLNAPAKGIFLVQVAAFKERRDAEHMKGSLILKGFDVNVVAVSKPQGNWYRVVVGPYPNKMSAQKAQMNLAKTERLHGMVTHIGG